MTKKNKILNICLVSLMSCTSVLLSGCDKNKPVTQNTNQWKVVLDYQDGSSRPATLYVDKESSVNLPSDAHSSGKTFAGWSLTKDGSVISNEYTPTENVTLYAIWNESNWTVSFREAEEGGNVETVEVGDNGFVETAPALTKTGYILNGWATVPNGTTPVDLSTYTINGNYTFYAIWKDAAVEDFNIVVKAGTYEGAPKDGKKTVESGKTIKASDSIWKLTREGYELQGFTTSIPTDGSWTIDDYSNVASIVESIGIAYTTKGSKAYKPTESATLYAVWSIKQFSAVWNYNYTDSPAAVAVPYLSNEVVKTPEDPTRPGYSFVGWYKTQYGLDDICVFDENTKLTKASASYYAHWKSNPVKTNYFDAEYVPIDPTKQFWGYSGSVYGQRIIAKAGEGEGCRVDNDYPLNSVLKSHYPNYVTYQYEKGCSLKFEINSSKATTASLYGNVKVEDLTVSTIASTGDNAVKILINDEPLTYSLQMSLSFQELKFGDISLKEGLNTIEIIVDNSNQSLGGTYKAVGFNTDYIRLADSDAEFTWSPIYDNLEAAL